MSFYGIKTLIHTDINNIKISADRLLALLNDLLDIAKLESGKMDINYSDGSLIEMTKTCIQEQQARMQELNIEHRCQHCTPDIASMDTVRISQVITNLLSNAIKFTKPEKGIDFTISNSSLKIQHNFTDIDVNALHFSIRDFGEGIPEGQLEHIFEKFTQRSGDELGTTKGTGLGLPISKEIIELHQGKIWAENHEEAGAVFNFIIPIEQEYIDQRQN